MIKEKNDGLLSNLQSDLETSNKVQNTLKTYIFLFQWLIFFQNDFRTFIQNS